MKKLFALIIVIVVIMCTFTACVNNSDDNGNLGGNGGVGGNGSNGGSGTTNPPATSNVLIAYFSCTNTTEAVAKYIQAETKGVLHEIVPAVPYTEKDLKYYTNCRADKEQADVNARPAISGSVEEMSKYSVVFIGYPIWHGQAPRIISTFLESYDFEGKTIIPFCTSASSGLGNSDTNLHLLAASANWLAGKRFPSGTTQQTVADWLDGLDVKFTPDEQEVTKMYITVNGNKLEVTLAQNSAVAALVERLKQGDVTYTAHDYGGFEKVGSLGFSLPTSDTHITTQAGDVILYSGNQIVLFYGSNSWDYTRLGKISGYTADELSTLLGAGKGNVEVTISFT